MNIVLHMTNNIATNSFRERGLTVTPRHKRQDNDTKRDFVRIMYTIQWCLEYIIIYTQHPHELLETEFSLKYTYKIESQTRPRFYAIRKQQVG